MSAESIPSVIKRELPSAVTYDLSTPGSVTITLPPQSTWSSGLHWHESHDEYLRVIQGSIHVILGDEEHIITASDGNQPEVKVARYAWHSWQRASPEGEPVVVVERTEPVDMQKAVFFYNLNGIILRAPAWDSKLAPLPSRVRALLVDAWVTLGLFVVFCHLDNFPVFIDCVTVSRRLPAPLGASAVVRGMGRRVDWGITHVTLLFAACLGWLLGVRPVQRRYTPDAVFARWQDENTRKLA